MLRKAVASLIFVALYAFVVIGPQAIIFSLFLNVPFYAFAQIFAFVTGGLLHGQLVVGSGDDRVSTR